MISKMNQGFSNVGSVSHNEELQQKNFNPKSDEVASTAVNQEAIANVAAEKKGMSNMEASVRRSDIERNFSWSESQDGRGVKNDPPESESLELENTLVSNFKAETKEETNNFSLNFTKVE